MGTCSISVVIATYNRPKTLRQLLKSLTTQTIGASRFQVVIVDDGSIQDITPIIDPFRSQMDIEFIRQPNTGVAHARQRGVNIAKSEIIVFLDDDMVVDSIFLAEHLRCHERQSDCVAMGPVIPDRNLRHRPLFERFHAKMQEDFTTRCRQTGTFDGRSVYTGNLSMPKALFLKAGGFDASFFVEDSELGVRLSLASAQFVFCDRGESMHVSDHSSIRQWLNRAQVEGRDWVRISRKHPSVSDASPWRHYAESNTLKKPLVILAITFPPLSRFILSPIGFRVAQLAGAFGFERVAIAGTTTVYGMQYFAGVRNETGSVFDCIADYRAYLEKRMRNDR